MIAAKSRPRQTLETPARRLALCADDYGLAAAIGEAVRRLAAAGRLTATSCMSASPMWPAEAVSLRPFADRIEVGLHVTLSEGRPLAAMPVLAPDGDFPSLPALIARSLARRLDAAEIGREIDRQIDRFHEHMGRLPDFLDGHQHVHQFPVIRDAVLAVFVRRLLPAGAWLRFSSMPAADLRHHHVARRRTLAVDLLGLGFRGRARALGIVGNRAFRGIRDFAREPPFAVLMPCFLSGIGEDALIMCHPASAADAGAAGYPEPRARVDEYDFLMSDAFPALLAGGGFVLAGLGRLAPSRARAP